MTLPMTPRVACRAMLLPLLAATVAVGVARSPDASAFERQDISCDLEDLTRTISLRVDPHAGYVCDVLYRKPDEGGTREVVWSARNEADYCKPRFEDLVQKLADRGWTCDYVDESLDADDAPEIGAAQDGRADDDEATSAGTKGKFRDWCVADVSSGESVEGAGSVKSYCNCVAEGMDAEGLSEEDAQVIFDGLSAAEGDVGGKRLNTLVANYETVVDSCS